MVVQVQHDTHTHTYTHLVGVSATESVTVHRMLCATQCGRQAEVAFVAALSSCKALPQKADILIELYGQCMPHYNPPKFRLIMMYS